MENKRIAVAKEAAKLLYSNKIKEYKEAKETAAANLGIKSLPSNFEIAIELDNLSEKMEGSKRHQRLIEMRKTALTVMNVLREYDPVLIGSVWRGISRLGSDIDIVAYNENVEEIRKKLRVFCITKSSDTQFDVNGSSHHSTHIWLEINGYETEVVVRPPEDKIVEKCEVFGDVKRGIRIEALERLMRTDPLRRFVPRRRSR
jgi:predicted nucleotidyltransferase